MKNLEKFSQVAPSRIKKIILIRNDKIGDMVVSSNVITALKTRFPDAKIDIVTSKENKALVEENKKINKIYVLNYSPRTPNEFSSYFKLSKQIKKEKYDLGVAIRGSFFNIFFLLFLGNVKYKIGFYTNKISKVFLNYAHLKDFKGHATHNMIKMLNGALGTNFKPLWPEIATSKKDGSDVNRFIKQNKIKKFISMVIDASDEKRQWPLRNFDQLIKHLNKEYPKHRLLLLSVDKKKMNFLLKRNPHCISLLRKNLRHIFLDFSFILELYFIILAGLPMTTALSGIFLITMLPAPMVTFFPIFTPISITECVPIQECSPISTGFETVPPEALGILWLLS